MLNCVGSTKAQGDITDSCHEPCPSVRHRQRDYQLGHVFIFFLVGERAAVPVGFAIAQCCN